MCKKPDTTLMLSKCIGFFFLINVGVRINLWLSWLVLQALKLTIIYASSDFKIYKTWTSDFYGTNLKLD